MKSHPNILIVAWFTLCTCLCRLPAYGYDLVQFSNKTGLSNSYVSALYQDQKGLLWIGTSDGLNIFDGKKISFYAGFFRSDKLILSGNSISRILETEKGVVWIQTNYGLDKFNMETGTSQAFADFRGETHLAQDKHHNLFVMKDDGNIYCFTPGSKTFQKMNVPPADFRSVMTMAVDGAGRLWIFAKGHGTYSYQILREGKNVGLQPAGEFRHTEGIRDAFAENEAAYFIDDTYALYEFDYGNRQLYYVTDLRPIIEKQGEIAAIIKQKDDYYIGFKNSGVMILRYMAGKKTRYEWKSTGIHTGVFCLMKDRFQDIVWTGTDGQGLYMYYNNAFSLNNTLTDNPIYQVNNPVRTLYRDRYQTLWIGTKGGGIMRLKGYRTDSGSATAFDRLTTANSALSDNSVYCFTPSPAGERLWIGTEKGLDVYSFATKSISSFPISAEGKKIRNIHAIRQLNDTTLWIATGGEGMIRITLKKGAYPPAIKQVRRFVVDKGRIASNYFLTLYAEGDSVLWFGNRGKGLFRMNTRTEHYKTYLLDQTVKSQAANDVFAIYKRGDGYWLGTGAGLLHASSTALQNNEVEVPGGTVHGILEDGKGNLWISTNQGLVRVNPKVHAAQLYDKGNGLSTTEFSDGAFYKDESSGSLFFGGTNGFVTIRSEEYEVKDYMPGIRLKGLTIFGKGYNLNDFMRHGKGGDVLRLPYNKNFFSIDFMAIDYINGNNYEFSYKLDKESDRWIACGETGNVTFSNLSPGKYTLLMKYRNNINGMESEPFPLEIQILPPWYAGAWAWTVYILLFLACAAAMAYYGLRQYQRKKQYLIEKMDRQKKEAVYESKLRFFTNITHEFCTPLTLIYGPCEKILTHAGTDGYVKQYAQMIKRNAAKLNNLIHELLEFRRLETDNRTLHIQPLPLSDELTAIADDFNERAESHHLAYCKEIAPGIVWNTDLSCFGKIIGNLLSNAFKYTPDGGTIVVRMQAKDDWLTLSVANSGKGIPAEDLPHVFDRYRILDDVEMNGEGSRTGLGLAICQSMVTLLKGKITVESEPEGMTTFTLRLPQGCITEEARPQTEVSMETGKNAHPEEWHEPESIPMPSPPFDEAKRTVMVIEDDPSMLWLVTDILSENYNVQPFNNARNALASIEQRQPDLILSDIMMPGIDGLTFTEKIKENKLYNHIPLVLLSALHHEDDCVKGIEAGAEAYVTKPFNIEYLKKIVERLIRREADLKAFYSSAFSSFKVENGGCIHQEDQKFLDKIVALIEKELSNPDLSVDLLSRELGYSTRQFYRRLKPITEKSPTDMIKEMRLTVAERLLLSTNLTIEEIIDKVGFTNRATFYKLFSQSYGMPPRKYREDQKQRVQEENRKALANDAGTPEKSV